MRLVLTIMTLFFLHIDSKSQESKNVNVKEIQDEIKQVKREIKEREVYVKTLMKKLDTMPIKKSPWVYKGNFNIVLSEVLRGDWAAGGLSNYTVQVVGHLEQDLRLKKHEWDNNFDVRLGFVKNFDAVSGTSRPIIKTMDLLQISTKYLYHLKNDKFSIGLESVFISQFTKTYDFNTGTYLFSDFLSPGILDLSPGFEYDPYPFLKIFISPLNSRLKFVINDEIINRPSLLANRYGHAVGEEFTYELGSKIDAVFEKEMIKGITLRSRLQLTNSWGRPSYVIDRLYTSRTNIDVNCQTDLFFKIYKSITINLGFFTIFDDDNRFPNVDNPDPDGKKAVWQIRQNVSLGFALGF